MKNILTVIVLLWSFCASQLLAQTRTDSVRASIQWSPALKASNRSLLRQVIPLGKEGYATCWTKRNIWGTKNELTWQRFSTEMKPLKEESWTLEYKKKALNYESTIKWGNQIVVFASFYNKGKDINYLFAQPLSKSFKPTRDLIKVGEIEGKNPIRTGNFIFRSDKDSTHLLIAQQWPYDGNDPVEFTLSVFDSTLQTDWSKHVKLPYENRTFEFTEIQVDKSGQAILLGKVIPRGGSIFKTHSSEQFYSLLVMGKNDVKPKEYKVNLEEGKIITQLTFRANTQNIAVCAGFYSDRSASGLKGVCLVRIDLQTGQILHSSTKPFDLEFRTEDLSVLKQRQVAKTEAEGKSTASSELYRYSLDELILRSDGGALLIAEQFYVIEQQDFDYMNYYGPRNNRITRIYNYNDIIVANVNPQGDLDWTVRVPKRQVSYNDDGYFSSYAYAITRDKIALFYNESPENLVRTSKNKMRSGFNGWRSVLAMAEIGFDGKLVRRPLTLSREVDVLTRPKSSRQIGRRQLLLYGESNNSYRMGILGL